MSVKVRVTSKGIIQEQGSPGLVTDEVASTSSGFLPFGQTSVTAFVTSSAATKDQAGVCTISGSSAWTITLPSTASYPGLLYTFRTTSVNQHIVSSSVDKISDPFTTGGALTFAAAVGSSATLMSDGLHWLVLGSYVTSSYAIA